MASVEQRSSGSSYKPSKKGGKSTKALTTEEEARRREELKEKLRDKLELDRRAVKIVERLLEEGVAEDFLADCAKFITPANYKDAIEERSIVKLCGYPVCSNHLGKIPTQQYKISTKTNKVYDITERKRFCSNFCYKASKEFELQISQTPLWLRQHESPPEIKLMKKGDGGSSGEEVILSVTRLREEDVENPQTAQPDDPHRSPSLGSHSDGSDAEQEQDFVSSVVSRRQGPRVHWGDLPKHTDSSRQGKHRTEERRKEKGDKEEREQREAGDEGKDKEKCEMESGTDCPAVEEAAAELGLCSLSETESKLTTETKPLSSSAPTAAHQRLVLSPLSQPGLHITQVGMSKRGAAGLRDLLQNHAAAPKPHSLRASLLLCLRTTLREWITDQTLTFLYGADHSVGSTSAGVNAKEEEVEELDEDDLEEEVKATDVQAPGGRPAAGPDYETLRKETQQLELRVREFYKGTWTPLEEGQQVALRDQTVRDAALPLVDSSAQHIIQKRIAVEKLNSCLRNVVGPLRLTMTDVTAHLNGLVRTFRFNNTNIIHKSPEWTLLALMLLHLLSAVSAVVREALETASSVDYLNALMKELGLQEQDLLNLVQELQNQTH